MNHPKDIIHNLESLLKLENTEGTENQEDSELYVLFSPEMNDKFSNDIDDFVEDLQAMIIKFKRDRRQRSKHKMPKYSHYLDPQTIADNVEFKTEKDYEASNFAALEGTQSMRSIPHEVKTEHNEYLKANLYVCVWF